MVMAVCSVSVAAVDKPTCSATSRAERAEARVKSSSPPARTKPASPGSPRPLLPGLRVTLGSAGMIMPSWYQCGTAKWTRCRSAPRRLRSEAPVASAVHRGPVPAAPRCRHPQPSTSALHTFAALCRRSRPQSRLVANRERPGEWRWRWDLNPRKLSLHTLSRRAPSATRRLHRGEVYATAAGARPTGPQRGDQGRRSAGRNGSGRKAVAGLGERLPLAEREHLVRHDTEDQPVPAVIVPELAVADDEVPVQLRLPQRGELLQPVLAGDPARDAFHDDVQPGPEPVGAGGEDDPGIVLQVPGLLLGVAGAEVQRTVEPDRRQRGHVRPAVPPYRGQPEDLRRGEQVHDLRPGPRAGAGRAERRVELGDRFVGHRCSLRAGARRPYCGPASSGPVSSRPRPVARRRTRAAAPPTPPPARRGRPPGGS